MHWWTGYDRQVSGPLAVTSAIGLAAPSAMDGVEAVLQVNGLGKCYRLYASPAERLKALLGLADHFKPHWALKDVSFQLRRVLGRDWRQRRRQKYLAKTAGRHS